MTSHAGTDGTIDFDNAEVFLRQAREAHARGDGKLCSAALYLLAKAVCLQGGPRGTVMHTAHLKDG